MPEIRRMNGQAYQVDEVGELDYYPPGSDAS